MMVQNEVENDNNNDVAAGDEGAVNAMQIRPELVLPSVSRSKLNNNGLVIIASNCVLYEKKQNCLSPRTMF